MSYKLTIQIISIGTGFALALILIVLLIYYFRKIIKSKRVIVRGQSLYEYYPTACAGSADNKPQTALSVSVDSNTFLSEDGTKLDPDDFKQFVVEGNSMQFCGIHEKDLIFVAKGFRIVQLKEYPYILVLKKTDAKPEKSEFKVRRAWGIAQFGPDCYEKAVRDIMVSEAFQKVKKLKGIDGNNAYKGVDQVVFDFLKNRLPGYEDKYIKCDNPDEWDKTVVISTTFDTDEKYIHFSIHPIANIIGIVTQSYKVKKAKRK